MIDYLTRFVWTFALRDEKSETVAQILVERFFPIAGIPMKFLSDKGAQFTVSLFRQLTDYYGIRQAMTTPLHPQCDGTTERVNRTIINILAKSLYGTVEKHEGDWTHYLPNATLAINVTPAASSGVSPYEAMYGRPPNLPSETILGKNPSRFVSSMESWIDKLPHDIARIWKIVQTNSEKAQQRQQHDYN